MHAQKEGELLVHFPPDIKSCRLRSLSLGIDRVMTSGESVVIKSGSLYLWDRFQK